MNRNPLRCTGKGDRYGCGNPIAYVARLETEDESSVFTCGKHLTYHLSKHRNPERWVVVAVADRKPETNER